MTHCTLLSCLMTKPTKWHVRPVWSESSLWAEWVAKDPSFLHVHSEDSDQSVWMPRPDWVDAQADLSLRWPHMPFCCFCNEAAHIITRGWLLKCYHPYGTLPWPVQLLRPPLSYPTHPTLPQGLPWPAQLPPPPRSYPTHPTLPQDLPWPVQLPPPPHSHPTHPTLPQGLPWPVQLPPPPRSYPTHPALPQGLPWPVQLLSPPPPLSYPTHPTLPQGLPWPVQLPPPPRSYPTHQGYRNFEIQIGPLDWWRHRNMRPTIPNSHKN